MVRVGIASERLVPDTTLMVTTHTSASIDETPDGLRITMPVPRIGCVAAFMTVWLLGWAVGEVSAVRALFSMGTSFAPGSAFLLIWLAGWTVGGVFAAGTLLMMIDGREVVTVGNGIIRRRAEAFGKGLSWRYPLERCGNLRPTGGSDGDRTFISFDFAAKKGEQTIRFGSGLTESRADEIAERVWAAFPELMPSLERRQREREAAIPEPPV
jgi:hypothetical protein